MQNYRKKRKTTQKAQASAKVAQTRLQHLLTASPAVIYSCMPRPPYATTFVSDNLQVQMGYRPEDFIDTPDFWLNRVHPEDRDRILTELKALFQHDKLCYEYRFQHRDGHYCWMHDEQRLVRAADGQPLEIVGYWIDITERKQAEVALKQHQEFLQTILNRIPVMIAHFDPQGQLQWLNREAEQVLGWSLKEAKQIDILAACYPDPHDYQKALAFIQSAHAQWGDFRIRLRSGRRLETRWANVRLSDGSRIGIGKDVTERKAYEAQLERQVNYDTLTGLPNRNLLQDRLSHALARAHRTRRWIAVLGLDLDRFKLINDSLGHSIGDALLQVIATRLSACLREGDTAARLGGDEFVLVLEDLPEKAAVEPTIQRIFDTLEAPFQLENREFFISASIGVSFFPQDGKKARTLLNQADIALHQAKTQGGRGLQYYTPALSTETTRRLSLENSLRYALDRGELELHYQPQVSLESGRVTGVEALLRWRHPHRGWISPAQFIPLAEENGLIVPIGEWVLNTACAQAKTWRTTEGLPLTIAVNLSARQFLQANFIAQIDQILGQCDLAATALKLEITESLLMQDLKRAITTLHALKERGLQLAIDDFGTGYSSLNYLKRFPLDQLKIDRAFIRDITREPDDAAIAQAIIALAHSLKLEVMAEGVESEAQVAFLRTKFCHAIQGYYVSRPLPPEQLAHWVRENRCLVQVPDNGASHTPTLLLVDDDPLAIATVQRLLREEPYRLLTCHDALEGLDLLARYPVDVVMADQRMPKMEGTEFLRRAREIYPQTVRILLTHQSSKTTQVEAINQGAIFKFIDKPISEKNLKAALRVAFLFHDILRQRAKNG
ncbi:EAL domain-containing protein [Nitrosococcus wardiae]|uniref:cyclic-guanylate-specific phosphodiesterase n=1 Tax=Nitrosococcus wardiae TaxID=1814290 RepID=A0A4P7C328_9GAMM|nr:EAL domain-containing protein [Nitrosococcus wardiae]QBQ56179.1 EAL domain-containing protein [Nitrosococcus wardiae]